MSRVRFDLMGPVEREVYDKALVIDLMKEGARVCQLRDDFVMVPSKWMYRVGRELKTESVSVGRPPSAVKLMETYRGAAEATLVCACYRRAQRQAPRADYGQHSLVAIRYYKEDLLISRRFAGAAAYELCSALRRDLLVEGYCPTCGVPFWHSPEPSLPLRCPFCFIGRGRADIALTVQRIHSLLT